MNYVETHNPFEVIHRRLTSIEEILHELKTKANAHVPSFDERMTRKEVCAKFKMSYPTLHDLMKKGLPFEKIGRKTLFRRSEVDFFFRNKKS